MSLILAKPAGQKLTLAKTYVGIDDPDAASYIALVEAADTAAGSPGGLETATKVAIHSFVKGCKADGIWPAIKASCILAGARTLSGALVPLAGTAPTNNNFVSGNYNRKTGLVGDGGTKYLNTNRANNADPLNSQHMSVYATTAAANSGTGVHCYIGANDGTGNASHVGRLASAGALFSRSRSTSFASFGTGGETGLIGLSRDNSASYVNRFNNTSSTSSVASVAPAATDAIFVFNIGNSYNFHTNARLAFYSIGESLDLAKLDARVTSLINAFGAAIP